MIEETINTLEQAKEIPAVKRLYENRFVKTRIQKFERFVEQLAERTAKKVIAPTRRKLTFLNWILINAVVIAYFAGLAKAQDIPTLEIVYRDYKIIGFYALIANGLGILFIGLGYILKVAAKIILYSIAILFAVFAVYWIYKWIMNFLNELFQSEKEPPIEGTSIN